jgi:hypothetical protein
MTKKKVMVFSTGQTDVSMMDYGLMENRMESVLTQSQVARLKQVSGKMAEE